MIAPSPIFVAQWQSYFEAAQYVVLNLPYDNAYIPWKILIDGMVCKQLSPALRGELHLHIRQVFGAVVAPSRLCALRYRVSEANC